MARRWERRRGLPMANESPTSECGIHRSTNSIEVNEWQNASAETLISHSRLIFALHWLPDGRLIYAPRIRYGRLTVDGVTAICKKFLALPSALPQVLVGSPKSVGAPTGKYWFPEGDSARFYIGTLADDGTHLAANKRLTLDEKWKSRFPGHPIARQFCFCPIETVL